MAKERRGYTPYHPKPGENKPKRVKAPDVLTRLTEKLITMFIGKSEAAYTTASIPLGRVDNTSTSTVFTATVDGITELRDGVCCYLQNGVVTSASGWTLNVNDLGAKPVYQTLAAASRSTTIFNVNYTMLFVYNEDRVADGCWDVFYGYNSDTNTIAYNVRRGNADHVMKSQLYRYEILFEAPDGTLVPANGVSNKPTVLTKALTTEKLNPLGQIFYYSTTTAVSAGAAPSASYLYTQHSTVDLRYAFNKGSTLTLNKEVYIQLVPQTDGSVKLSGDNCIVQDLPTTDDGYVYLYLGRAYSTSQITLDIHHPIYWFKDGTILDWTPAIGKLWSTVNS